MNNPSVVEVPEGAWLKIATNVLTGMVYLIDASLYYYQTYRLTGEPAPDAVAEGEIPVEAIKIFNQTNEEPIGATEGIDVYLMCSNMDDDSSDTGKVRVDV